MSVILAGADSKSEKQSAQFLGAGTFGIVLYLHLCADSAHSINLKKYVELYVLDKNICQALVSFLYNIHLNSKI